MRELWLKALEECKNTIEIIQNIQGLNFFKMKRTFGSYIDNITDWRNKDGG